MSQWKVDVREPPELVAYFKDKGAKVEMLESGDYVFADLVGFERKSAGDFCDFDRMFVQVDEMIDRFPFAFLVVDRKLEDILADANKNYHRNMLPPILGAIASLAVRGCPPIFFGNQSLMLTTMEKMAAKCVDGKDRSSKRLLRTRNLDQRGNVAVNVLRAFGVGSGRAEDIAEEYGDVGELLDILKNNPEKFKEVGGVGDKTIDKIKSAFNKKEVSKPGKVVCPYCKNEIVVIDWEADTVCSKCKKTFAWF
jgi:ERCC4-type nuclease